MITDEYAAGFFDGEGCVTACLRGGKQRNSSPILLVCIGNTNLEVLEMHKTRWGGSIAARGGKHFKKVLEGRWQQQYQWVLASKMAMPFLKAIQHHVVIKKDVVMAALRYGELQTLPYRSRMLYDRIVESGGRKRVSPTIRPEFRRDIMKIHDEIKSLNSRTYNAMRGTGITAAPI